MDQSRGERATRATRQAFPSGGGWSGDRGRHGSLLPFLFSPGRPLLLLFPINQERRSIWRINQVQRLINRVTHNRCHDGAASHISWPSAGHQQLEVIQKRQIQEAAMHVCCTFIAALDGCLVTLVVCGWYLHVYYATHT